MAEKPQLKILHISDIHLGVETYSRPDPSTGLSSRLLDYLSSFDQAVHEALDTPVDLFLFTGDAFKTRDPTPTLQREFASRVRRLASNGIPVFLLVGNHDLPAGFGKASTLDIYHTLEVPNVFVGRRPGEIFLIETRHGPVQIVALPWIYRGGLLAKDEYKNSSIEQVNERLIEKVKTVLDGTMKGLDPSIPAVLAAHATVMGATLGSERNIMLGHDVVFPKSVLVRPEFDYVALGHIHKHQVINTNPLALYAGSIERIDFGEEKDDKGYVLVKIEKGQAEYQFRSVKARRFITIEVDADSGEPVAEIMRQIEQAKVADAIVRLTIHTTPEAEAAVDEGEIMRALKDAYYVAAVKKEVERPVRARFSGLSIQSLTSLDALKEYLRQTDTSSEWAKVLLEYGERLIRQLPK